MNSYQDEIIEMYNSSHQKHIIIKRTEIDTIRGLGGEIERRRRLPELFTEEGAQVTPCNNNECDFIVVTTGEKLWVTPP